MTKVHDYSAFEADDRPGIGDNIMARLSGLAKDQVHAELRVVQLEEELRQAKESLRHIAENQLPSLMEEAGHLEDVVVDGMKITLKETIRGSIPIATQADAFAWLEENGHEKIIKRQFTIDFGKSEDAWANKFERDCAQRKSPLNMKRKKAVHPQTLQSFVRTQLEEGVAIPMETFGVFRQRVAKVKVK
jgi:hypothetical protein